MRKVILSLVLSLGVVSVSATEYWFAVYSDDITTKVKGFPTEVAWVEEFRWIKNGDGTERLMVFIEATQAEFNAGFGAFPAAKITAAIAAISDAQSPDNGWSNLTRRERFLIRCIYKLAKIHSPALTLQQFRVQLRTQWDATPESE